ncbi:type III secretion system gatekeeper subunit SctW [Vibrio quintilis]|uniref:HrpJ-like domain protein n=1 Tax=Vibrio quintilis TaxID=1117707 RepID=A0A1M7YSR7_9VIBR|nr:type III secretion system gatekeeper subunit SctW [Vibrio quintilis]SHO55657.1 HrpJ-like domain protein [Vibrio quintilis]
MNIHPAINHHAPGTALNASQPLSTAVQTPVPVNDMSDAMEEISMKFSESVERNSKSLEDRRVRPRQQLRIDKLEALYSLLTSQDDRQQDEKVRQLLMMGQKNLSLSRLMTHADDDPATADILLQHAIHRAKSSQDNPLLNQLRQTAHSLEQEYSQEIQAGINTAQALAKFSQDPQQRKNIRELYYRNVVGQASLPGIFDTLLSQFDERHFSQGIHTLIRAMTDDLSSQFTSMPPGQLKGLLKDLTACQQLSHILGRSRELLQKFAAKGIPGDMSSARLTRRLIDLTQSSIYPREIKSLANDTVGQSPLHHTKLLNAVYPLVREMPLPLWKDVKSRQGALNLMLRMMTEYAHHEQQLIAAELNTTALHTSELSTSKPAATERTG